MKHFFLRARVTFMFTQKFCACLCVCVYLWHAHLNE